MTLSKSRVNVARVPVGLFKYHLSLAGFNYLM
jgi:hypothetical protein